ncbi:MAG: SGNH/GDSL hydrolase family protein [Spongiibacteraceae bacterium]
MFYPLVSLLLLPLLLIQGGYTRRTTPVLPEPVGPRSGLCGKGSAIRLLITGDSAAAGVGARDQQRALSGQLLSALQVDYQLDWQLSARSGDSSTELLAELVSGPLPATPYDVVVVSVGVNDVIARRSAKAWQANLQAINQCLQSRYGARYIIWSAVPPMHKFSALPQPLRWWLGQRAINLNRQLSSFAERAEGCHYLAVKFPLEAHFLATDGFHPGEAAYTLWAETLAENIRASR